MFPDQQNQPGAPQGPAPSQVPQQAPNGQYEVLPPLPTTNNTGHSGHNPYEFIVNPAPVKKASLFGGGGSKNRLAVQLLVIVCIVVVVIAAVAIAFSALAPKGPLPGLTSIAQRQQEIIRVSTAATQQATSQDTKNFVVNVETVVASSQSQVLAYLSSHNVKLKDKTLALDQSAQTDTQLTNALTINTYDSVVVQNLLGQIATYQTLLKSTYKDTANPGLKQTLQTGYNNTNLLVEQAQNIKSGS